MKANGARAAVLTKERGNSAYRMFEASDLSAEGAFLAGSLLLEQGEEFEMELSFDDDSSLKLRARVISVAQGEHPGMSVSFSGLGESTRKQLETKLGTTDG